MYKNKFILTMVLVLVLLAGCTSLSTSTSTSALTPPTPTVTAVAATQEPALCKLTPVVVPTRPAVVPDYTQLDEGTGLHMTGTAQDIDLAAYRLQINGLVNQPLSLSYDDLRCMPKVTAAPTILCPGFFTDVATWSGVPLKYLLDRAGIQSGAQEILLTSADGYTTTVPLTDALKDENYLAYEFRGEPLPILHGFPVRAVFPSLQGNKWAKWLMEITVQ
jgi:DMSO/TMAO reductase YedYZ molybdopterin-dependent catalytic subunit